MESKKLTGVDTNVLVRLIMRDDEAQHLLAYNFFTEIELNKSKVTINSVVLTELSFLLLRTYKLPKNTFIDILFSLCQKSFIVIDNEIAVLKTLEVYKTLNVDFHDLLISNINSAKGVNFTISFDKKASSRITDFKLLK